MALRKFTSRRGSQRLLPVTNSFTSGCPRGNGKTISTKAIMKTTGVPCLYVKSFVCKCSTLLSLSYKLFLSNAPF